MFLPMYGKIVVKSILGIGLVVAIFYDAGLSGAEINYANLTGDADITISSADTGIAQPTNSSFTGNWIVNGTLQSMNGSHQFPDSALGSGTVTLNDGATLLPGVSSSTYLSNAVKIQGNVTFGGKDIELRINGNITGYGNITKNTSWSVYLNGDNSAYTGNWTLKSDWTWSLNKWSSKQDSWGGSGDYSFGSGVITLNGGGIAFSDDNSDYYVWNDIVVTKVHPNFMKGGKSVTLSGKLSGEGDITLQSITSGSNTVKTTPVVHVRGTQNGDFSGDWTVNQGYTLTTNNYGNAKESGAKDTTLGSGSIILNGGTLRTVNTGEVTSNAWLRRISNDLVVNADSVLSSTSETEMYLFGNISGSGNLKETVTYSLYLYGDNSAFSGDWELTSNWIWSNNEWSSPQDGWAGSGDYSFGSGKIKLNGGELAFDSNSGKDYYVWNDLEIAKTQTHLVKGGKSVTLSGKITGSEDIHLQKILNSEGNVSGNTTPILHLRGDNSGFSGNWHIQSDHTVTTDSGTTSGTDVRFGSGTIYLDGGIIQSARSGSAAYVLNNIVVGTDSFLQPRTHELSLNGDISGTGDLTVNGGGYTLYLRGDNSSFEGDWHILSDYVCINNDGTKTPSGKGDYSFGQGTVYLGNNTGIRTSSDGTKGFVGANITVESKQTGNLRNGKFVFGGIVTVDGILEVNLGKPSANIAGTLQGNGTVSVPVLFSENGILSAGTVGTVGDLSFTSTVDLSRSRILVDIGMDGAADKLIFNGATTLAESMMLDVNLLEDVTLAGGDRYDILEFQGDLIIPQDFDWSTVFSSQMAYLFNASFVDNVLSLTVDGASVPEPGSGILLLLGLAGGYFVLRRKGLC